MGMNNIQVPPVGMRIPVTPNAKAPSSVHINKPKEESKGELDMNLQDEIKFMKQRIAELEQQAEQEQKFPQFGDDYWYVDSDTDVMDTASYNGEYDQGRLSIGNVFRTKEQAEFAVEKLKVESELRKFSKPFEEGKNNYFMVFDTNYASVDTLGMSYSRVQGVIYFESEEKAQQAIQTVGEARIKKYIFGVS